MQNFREIANFIWSVADLLRGDFKTTHIQMRKRKKMCYRQMRLICYLLCYL